MVDVGRIGGIPDPRRPGDAARLDAERRRARPDEAAAPTENDGVAISPEARRAAEALRFAEFARSQPDVRPDSVEAARDRLERGDLDQPAVLRRTVQRILDNLT